MEHLLSFNQAAGLLPHGARPSSSTWWRWWRKGVRGVRLQTYLVGGRRFTTQAAVEAFVAALTAAANGQQQPLRTPRQRHAAIERAERELGVQPQVQEEA